MAKKHKKYLLLDNYGQDGWNIIDEYDRRYRAIAEHDRMKIVLPDTETLLLENITDEKGTTKRG